MKCIALLFVFIFVAACTPLNPQKDMENIVLQISAKYVEERKPDFDIAFKNTKTAILNKDVDYLVSIMYFDGPNKGLTSEQANAFISNIVKTIIAVSPNWKEYKRPRLSKSSNNEFGYTYFVKLKNETCEVSFEINYIYPEINKENKVYLLNIKFNEQKGTCMAGA